MNLTYTDIIDQYNILGQTIRYLESERDRISRVFKGRLVFMGCGSSYSLAKSMAAMYRMRTEASATALVGGDVLLNAERYTASIEGCTLVAVSRSGDTSEIMLALERLKFLGCNFKLVSLTCAHESLLSRISDFTLEMPWAFDGSVCRTRTVSCLYLAFAYCLACLNNDKALGDDLKTAVYGGVEFINKVESKIVNLASLPWTHSVVLGDAELCGICEAGARTFQEICQLPSNYYHLLDSHNGPMMLFDEETLVVATLGSGSEYELELVRDMSKKGSVILLFTDNCFVDIEGVHVVSFGCELCHIARGLPFILLCQLTTYYKSFHSGSNPDADGFRSLSQGTRVRFPPD